MTSNQINYWNLQENKRHNIAGEQETYRHNLVGEQETERHNRATETFSMQDLDEKSRHNQATEKLSNVDLTLEHSRGLRTLEESSRHNQAMEKAEFTGLGETMRHNLESEMLANTREQHEYDINSRRTNISADQLLNDQLARIDRSSLTRAQIRDVDNRAYQIREQIRQGDDKLALDSLFRLGDLITGFTRAAGKR